VSRTADWFLPHQRGPREVKETKLVLLVPLVRVGSLTEKVPGEVPSKAY
jgi:hypothetical protein